MKPHIKFNGQHQAVVSPLQTFKNRLINPTSQPRAKVFGMAVFTTFAAIISFNQPTIAKDTTFFCANNTQEIPTTYTQHGDVPVIRWVSWDFAASGYTPEQRCKKVSNIAISTPVSIQTSQTTSKSNQLAQAEVKNWAWVYGVMEKVIRANGLDEHTWRVQVINQYIDNASASDVNLVTVYDGLLDKINGDDAALAFIIGHELAHNTQRHLAVGAAVKAEVLQRLNAEADTEIQKLVADEQNKFQDQKNLRDGVGLLCGVFGSVCRNVPVANGLRFLLLNSQGQPDPNTIVQRKKEIVALKQQEFNNQQIQLGRRQESEADEFGYSYMVKAGYDPKGALRAMELLARIPIQDPHNDVHPPATQRIEALQTLIRERSSQALVAEGAAILRQTKPLTYAASSDGKSLLINSRFGSK